MTLTLSFTAACPWADPAQSSSMLPLPATPPSPWWAPLLWGPASPILLLLPVLPGTPSIPHTNSTFGEGMFAYTTPDISHYTDQPSGLHILDTPRCSHRHPPSRPLPLQRAQSRASVPLATSTPHAASGSQVSTRPCVHGCDRPSR